MGRIALLLAITVAVASGSPASTMASGNGPRAGITAAGAATLPLSYLNAAGVSEDVLESLRREVHTLFGTLGVVIREIDYEAITSNPDPGGFHIVVMLLANEPASFGLAEATLGLASRTPPEGAPYRAAHIFVPSVARAVLGCSENIAAERFGKVLARVVMHELVHILAPGFGHGGGAPGLMAPVLRCTFMLGTSGDLGSDVSGLVLARLAEGSSVRAGGGGKPEK